MAGRERDQPDLREQHRRSPGRGAEDGDACLVRHGECDGREDARLVADDDSGIESRQLRHQREESVPERERVPGMEASVPELVHSREMQAAELVELAHAGEMEERVAPKRAGDVPEENPEDQAGEQRGSLPPPALQVATGPRDSRREGGERHERQHDIGEPKAAVHGEDEEQRDEDRRHSPCDGSRDRPLAESTRDQRPGQQDG